MPLAAGRQVFGWMATEALQKVKVTAIPDFVLLEQIRAHMAQFVHVLKAESGRDKHFMMAQCGLHVLRLAQESLLHVWQAFPPGAVLLGSSKAHQ